MTTETVTPRPTIIRGVVLCVAVVLMAMALAWAFFAMRSVMDIGGACADGGAYVSAQPCPDGSWLIAVAIPLLLITAFTGTMAATPFGAPDLLLPMWFFLFGLLGANFLEYGLWSDPWVWSWVVCGVMFELMAFPALYFWLPGVHDRRPKTREEKKLAKALAARNAVDPPWEHARKAWWAAYLVLGAAGGFAGYASFQAIA